MVFSDSLDYLPIKKEMSLGMSPPRMMVVRQTMMSTVLLMMDTLFSLLWFPSMVRISAKATDPRMVPDAQTTDSSLLLTFHFMHNLNKKARPNIAMNRAMKQMMISATMKLIEKTSLK